MSKPVGARIIALFVFLLGIATLIAGGIGSAWAFETPDAPLFFQVALPILTAWLGFALARLAFALHRQVKDEWTDPLAALASAPKRTPDEAMRAASPDAQFYQEIPLPSAPGMPWELRSLWRQKVVIRITMRDESRRYMVSWRRRSVAAQTVSVD